MTNPKYIDPPHRKQKWPLPETAPALELARLHRQAWKDAMARVSHSQLTEHERESRLDNDELPEYLD